MGIETGSSVLNSCAMKKSEKRGNNYRENYRRREGIFSSGQDSVTVGLVFSSALEQDSRSSSFELRVGFRKGFTAAQVMKVKFN